MQYTEKDMQFTKAEKERLNQLYGKDFEGVTPDDVKLIARWEVYNATMQTQIDDMQTEIKTQADKQLKDILTIN